MNSLVSRNFIWVVGLIFPALVSTAQSTKHFSGDITDESAFNNIARSAQRATRDLADLPAAFSLKQFAPLPGDQGKHGTCVAWSAGYAARTISYCIQHQVTDAGKIQSAAFSPGYLYYFIKSKGDDNCVAGSKIQLAMQALTDTGDVLLNATGADCISSISNEQQLQARSYAIKAFSSLTNVFGRISKNEVIAIKKSIAEKKPVIVSLRYFPSLDNIGADGFWKQVAGEQSTNSHAVCIIGYDDNKAGGSFEVINSWGVNWGNAGFFWLGYDALMQVGSYALELMDKEPYDPKTVRSFESPRLKGSLDLVRTNEGGNDESNMPVQLKLLDESGNPANNDNILFAGYGMSIGYPGGTSFKIKFTTNAPAFVYILSVDDQRTVSTLFPYASNISAAINSSNATVYLPSEQKHYTLDAGASRDRIVVLYSKAPLDFNSLKAAIGRSGSNWYGVISSMLGNRLIPVKNANFNNGRISFDSLAGELQVICFFIDMNHS